MRIRHTAKKAFIQVDSGRKVASAILRKAAPKEGNYRVGDLITYQRNHRADGSKETAHSKRWSPAARIIGFEGRNQKRVCWVICEGIPICVELARIRPANNDQLMAYRYLHEHSELLPREEQQAYVELQRSRGATTGQEDRDSDADSENSDLPSLGESSDEEGPRRREVESDDDESDDDEDDEHHIVNLVDTGAESSNKRNPESDPNEGRSVRLRAEESQLEDELLLEQESSRDRVTRSRSPVRSWEQDLRHDPDAESLLRVWNRTGTTGRGREILERREEVSDAQHTSS